MKKVGIKSKLGGAREGAGRPKGQTKKKVSVSLDAETLDAALEKWGGDKTSQLLDSLLKEYVKK